MFALSPKLKEKKIRLILIQTHEAHSSLWPVGLDDQPEPHSSFEDRVRRANEFKLCENPPYDIYIDGWDDQFEQTFRAWPDKYYYIDHDFRILKTSSYGQRSDALIDYDCLQLLLNIIA